MLKITLLTSICLALSGNAFAFSRKFDCGDDLVLELKADKRIRATDNDVIFWMKPASTGSNGSGTKYVSSKDEDDIELFVRAECLERKATACKMKYRNTTSDINEFDCRVVK
mgnify:CR=1 FL=1